MPVGVRLKRTHDTGPRVSSGVRPKKSAGSPRSKDQSSGNAKWHRNEHESDTAGYCGEPYRRGRKMDHGAESNVKFKRGEFDSEFAHHKRKGFDDEGRRTQGFRVSNRKSFAVEGKRAVGDDSGSVNGSCGNVKFARKRPSKPPKWKRKSDESDVEELSGREARTIRVPLRRNDDDRSAGDHHKSGRRGRVLPRREGRDDSVEVSVDKLGSKAKKRDWIMSAEKHNGEGEVKSLEKHSKVKDDLDRSPSKKLDARQTQPIDESGKRTDGPPKKRKRIRLDPYDISNKRLVDEVSDDEEEKEEVEEKAAEEEIKISKNAQFRAIQPSSSILSFVEENLVGRRRLIELQKAGYNVKLSAPLDNVPHSTSTERERIEENVFRNKLEFFAAAKISSSFPPPLLPEIAFAGRSNVGKSSLLNALTRQWGVSRTSDKPGYTQSINFFRLASKLCLVDLPGYGFAYAKEEVKDAWEELVKEYVSTRDGLQRVCLLIDAKWGMKPRDHELIDLMERSKTPYQILLTKTDAVFPIDVARRAMQIQENLKANRSIVKPVMMVSSKSGAGIRSLRTVLAKLSRFVKP